MENLPVAHPVTSAYITLHTQPADYSRPN